MEISMQPDGSELPFLESNDPDEVDLNQFRMYSALAEMKICYDIGSRSGGLQGIVVRLLWGFFQFEKQAK